MKVLIRKTLTGSEYWDTEAKRTLLVAEGEKPDFEVTEDPKSMIAGVDLARGKDMTVDTREPGDGTNLEDMTIPQLREFAKQIEIIIPSDVKKKDDIIALLVASAADDGE